MIDHVAVHGGYVWSYLPDLSRRWGEIEARPSMVWVQPPGTATMGHLFLDAYHATGDPFYYRAAAAAADALIRGQHRSGGWNYLIDFAGPADAQTGTRQSAATPGGWRNSSIIPTMRPSTMPARPNRCSCCCACTWSGTRRNIAPPLERAIQFVLRSQYPIGGWPQRWPHDDRWPAYGDYITFNDDVAAENIRFLLMVYRSLGDARVRDPIVRAMNVFLVTQQGQPQPGWGLQYTLDLQPAGGTLLRAARAASPTPPPPISAS